MSKGPKVIEFVVSNDLCIGCGLCVYKCPSDALEMHWNKYGFWIPKLKGDCDTQGDCLKICPFNPIPEEEVRTESEIAELFLTETTKFHYKIGRYNGLYVGYSNDFRLTSSSGGIATFFLTELLDKEIVSYVFTVKESEKSGIFYEYNICRTKQDLINASKTKYYPVTLASVFSRIRKINGKVAIVGVACFIKAIRLVQHQEPELVEKIPFLIGIICGGVKSRFYTEYLASKAGILTQNVRNPQYRIKNIKSTSNDYGFGCYDFDSHEEKIIKMRTVGDMWGTGFFKANSCDYCEDVTTELADISLGDAWLKPYIYDGKGTNVIVTRSNLADYILQEGKKGNKIFLEELELDKFISSQEGSFNHRHTGLPFRISKAKKKGQLVPPKRFSKVCFSFLDFQIVQFYRMKCREMSLEVWEKTSTSLLYDRALEKILIKLRRATSVYHFRQRYLTKRSFGKIIRKVFRNSTLFL